MVWFYCGDCGDSIKKPKLQSHCGMCSASYFTCIDCSRTFDKWTAKDHVSCVTEHEKYALGATKPGGYASQGCFADGAAAPAVPRTSPGGPVGEEFLSQRAPWKCNLCNVGCTSRETLLGHAQGAKHVRRSRAALAARAAEQGEADGSAKAQGASGEAAAAPDGGAVAEAAKSGAAAGNGVADATGKAEGQCAQGDQRGEGKATKVGKKRKKAVGGGAEAGANKKRQGEAGAEGSGEAGCVDAAQGAAKASGMDGERGREAAGAIDGRPMDKATRAAQRAAARESTVKADGGGDAVASAGKRVKWKGLAAKALEAKGGSMKLSKLQKMLLEKVSASKGEQHTLRQQLMQTLRKSSRFAVEGNIIKLSAAA